jgi:transposase
MPQVDLITGQPRTRRWTLEDKLSILAAAFAPGAVALHVAKRASISTSQLYTWRKELMTKPLGDTGFARIVTAADAPVFTALPPHHPPEMPATAGPTVSPELPAIEIDIRGNKIRMPPTTPSSLAIAIIRALTRR